MLRWFVVVVLTLGQAVAQFAGVRWESTRADTLSAMQEKSYQFKKYTAENDMLFTGVVVGIPVNIWAMFAPHQALTEVRPRASWWQRLLGIVPAAQSTTEEVGKLAKFYIEFDSKIPISTYTAIKFYLGQEYKFNKVLHSKNMPKTVQGDGDLSQLSGLETLPYVVWKTSSGKVRVMMVRKSTTPLPFLAQSYSIQLEYESYLWDKELERRLKVKDL